MLENARKYRFIPEEVYSERRKTADDGTLAKVLFQDVGIQTRLIEGIASVDVANFYDSAAHAIASLVFQALGIPSIRCSGRSGAANAVYNRRDEVLLENSVRGL